jgi:hypothetical protein
VGKPLVDDDLISYVINGLNHVYAPFVTSLSFATRDHAITFDEFQSELLCHEIFLNQHLASSPSRAHAIFTVVSFKLLTSARIVYNIVYVKVRGRIHRELCCKN